MDKHFQLEVRDELVWVSITHYQPEETQTLEHPGCPEGVEFSLIDDNGNELSALFDSLTRPEIWAIEERCLEWMEPDDDY